eukprot:gnl/TRDRNA2_/TRDRNA2_177506_c0_seq14.p1 gnl/TRDRNA2_/TRDRNA2_177506_c0~~gnl/TRDRNA2_/TRDRNA2_177506_c0_seq14.p1  ORF type:complete len:598 (-),score=140.07 gnl/TRDRNA2_/TRDRNA2_177506_c0_seq14:35-1768(-)
MGQASCQEIVKGQDVPVPKAPPASGGSSACPRSPRSMAAKARSSAPVCNDTKDQMVTRVTANSGSNGNTGRRPSCLDPLPGAEPQTPAIESPRLKCPTSPRGLPGAASRVHGASDMELPAVAKMRTELAAKQKALQSLRQEGAQHKQLMEVLEQEAFQKDEDLRGLRVGEAARREAVALIAELRRKDADIDHLRKKVESEEGMLRALVVEAQTKGDAVEDLVTAITEQSMLQTGGPKLQALNKKLGAGTRICVLGGTKFNDVDTEAIVKAVAKELSASLGHSAVFITGGMPGVQETFAKHCVAESRLFNLLPDGQQSNYGVGEDIHAGSNLDERIQVYGQLGHVYISFEGGPGVSKEAKAAVARSAGVVPLIRTGGASGGMFNFPAEALKKPSFATDEQWQLLASNSFPPSDSAKAVVEIVKGFLIAQASAAARPADEEVDQVDFTDGANVPRLDLPLRGSEETLEAPGSFRQKWVELQKQLQAVAAEEAEVKRSNERMFQELNAPTFQVQEATRDSGLSSSMMETTTPQPLEEPEADDDMGPVLLLLRQRSGLLAKIAQEAQAKRDMYGRQVPQAS